MFEIDITIYSNSEKSEHFLVTECFINLFLEVLISYKLEQLEFKLEKKLGFRNMHEKFENYFHYKKILINFDKPSKENL